MEIEKLGNVGPQGYKNADGAKVEMRVGITGDHLTSPQGGRYAETTVRGKVFTATSNGSTITQTSGITSTGLVLYNPAGSGVNMSLLEVTVAIATPPGGAAPLLLVGNTDVSKGTVAFNTLLSVYTSLVGSPSTSLARVGSSATLPNSTPLRAIGGGAVAAGSINPGFIKDDVSGALVLAPNTCIGIQSFTTQVGIVATYTWSEIPV